MLKKSMCFLIPYDLDILKPDVTVTPQQEISKTFKFFQNPLKILNVYFGGDNVYFWGDNCISDNIYFWGHKVYSGEFSKIFGFWEFLFLLLGGFWDSVGRGAL